MRNKKLLWILVMVVLVVSSIAVEGAIMDSIRGLTSKVSGAVGGVSITHILVNTILIGLFIFIVVHLLPDSLGGNIFKPKSKTANAAFFIALIGISIFLAIRIGGMYIWNEEVVVRPAFRYLFGEEPLGILRPTRILIFIGASFLLSWLFVQVVKIGQGKNKIDIVIATILAAEMTYQGLTKGMLITLGQIVSVGLLYRQFKREGETGWSPSAAVWSWGLVLFISAIAFPGQGFLAPFTGIVRAMGYFTYLLLLIMLGIGAIVFGGFLKRKEKEAKGRIAWAKNALQYIGQRFINLANKIDWPIIGGLLKEADIHDLTPGAPEREEFSFSIKKIWVELSSLMNYLLRLEVYYSKGGAVLRDLYKTNTLHKKHDLKIYPKETLHMWFDLLKNGTGYIKKDGGFEPDTSRRYKQITNEGEEKLFTLPEEFYGKMGVRFILLKFLEQFKKDIEGLTKGDKVKDEEDAVYKKIPIIREGLIDAFGKMKDCEKRYDKFVLRIGARNVIDSYRLNILNQLNRYGYLFKHNYKFAKKGAKIYNVGCFVDKSKDQPFGKIIVDRDPGKAIDSGQIVKENLKDEVDLYGFFLEDWNRFRLEKTGGKKTIRRVMFKDAIEHPDFREACKWQGIEWDFYIKDVRDGRFHPMSRTVSDYTELHAEKRKYNYSGVKQSHGVPNRGNPAFDREALKDIGRFVSLGRRNPNDEEENDMNFVKNPFPAVTTIGMTSYVSDYIDEFGKESANKQKRLFAWETGEEEKLFTNYPEKKGEG